MGKLRLSMLGVFCAGLLLIGIGVGVTFTEFTNLTYRGGGMPPQAESREQTFVAELKKDAPVYLDFYRRNVESDRIRYYISDQVAPGSLQVQVAYETMGPKADLTNSGSDTADNFYVGWSNWDEMAIFMSMKDTLLQDLKAGQLNAYSVVEFTEVTVRYHPDDAARMHLPNSAVAAKEVPA